MRCPKCHSTSGDNWSNCNGACPMPMSPHYKKFERYTYLSSDPTRTDDEDSEMLKLRDELLEQGYDLGLPPVDQTP
jgi:hypothetical protein